MKVDLHAHSLYSEDNATDPEESIQQAIQAGLDGIAFTEHNSYLASEPLEVLKEKYRNAVKVFRGVEYSCAEGHVLLFGLKSDNFNKGLYAPIDDIIRIAREEGAVAVIPHPFREWSLLQIGLRDLSGYSAVEIWNGRNQESENAMAQQVAEMLRIPTTGGSDAHEPHEVGRCYTKFRDRVTYDNFVELLKAGRYYGVDSRKTVIRQGQGLERQGRTGSELQGLKGSQTEGSKT